MDQSPRAEGRLELGFRGGGGGGVLRFQGHHALRQLMIQAPVRHQLAYGPEPRL